LIGQWEWFPLAVSVADLVDDGFSLRCAVLVIFGLAETTLAMFLVLILKTLFPGSFFKSRILGPIVKVLEYVLAFNIAMAIVHYIIFTEKFAQAVKITISVVVLIPAVLSVVLFVYFGVRKQVEIAVATKNAFIDFLKESTLTKLLFSAFSVTLLILFILVFAELTVGIQGLFATATTTGLTLFFVVLIMQFGISLLDRAVKQ